MVPAPQGGDPCAPVPRSTHYCEKWGNQMSTISVLADVHLPDPAAPVAPTLTVHTRYACWSASHRHRSGPPRGSRSDTTPAAPLRRGRPAGRTGTARP